MPGLPPSALGLKLQAMVTATDFDQIQPGLAVWHGYDSAVKADLFSQTMEFS